MHLDEDAPQIIIIVIILRWKENKLPQLQYRISASSVHYHAFLLFFFFCGFCFLYCFLVVQVTGEKRISEAV